MMALSLDHTEQIVNAIVVLLQQRERAVFATRQSDLAKGLSPSVYVRHANLHIQQPDLGFMRQLAALDTSHPAVATALDAMSYGIHLHISVHQQLLTALPVSGLSKLAITLCDHQGQAIWLCPQSVVGYSDVIRLNAGILLLDPRSLLTPLASDVLTQRHIPWIRSE
jgi:microcompartment protein PduM